MPAAAMSASLYPPLSEHLSRSIGGGDEAEARALDRVLRETALLEVRARLGTALAQELALAELEEVVKQIGAAVAWRSALDRRRVHASASREVLDRADELFAARNGAAADVCRPERRLAAVDEEAARRRPVRDDALGPNAEPGVRVLLVGRDPAPRVATPPELGERLVETFAKARAEQNRCRSRSR